MIAGSFKELVEGLEHSARESEGTYRLKVALLAALGYAYLILVVAALGWATWLIIGIVKGGRHVALLKFAIPMAALAFVGLRSLWVRLDAPTGIAITAKEAPQLFALLERIRSKLKGPAIHQVLVTDEFNAAIMQLPRFGLFGGSRNYLIIGLPMMQSLSLEQFAAVLAHEYGHLSGAHGTFSAWIYRVRETWMRILDSLVERPTWGAGLFLRFFRWYVPYFQAYTFVLARSNEYEADRAAADVAGSRAAADALVQAELGARYYDDEFWPRFASGADRSPRPAFLPHAQLPLMLNIGIEPEAAQAWLNAALQRATGLDDTHPCLKDRLKALGQPARVPDKAAQSAARVLMGAQLPRLAQQLDQAWAKANLQGWGDRFKETIALKERADRISAKAKAGEKLNGQEWYDFARACERLSSEEKAIGHYRRAVEAAPEHSEAHLALGALLLKRRDASGLAHLDKAIQGGDDTRWDACATAARYLREAGRVQEAERYELKLRAQHARESEAAEHRVFLTPDDSFTAHGLTAKDLALCRATFKRMPRVDAVHAVRKMLPGGVDSQLVFVVEPRSSLARDLGAVALEYVGMSAKQDPLADDVSRGLRLAMPFTVFLREFASDDVMAKIEAVPESLVFDEHDRRK